MTDGDSIQTMVADSFDTARLRDAVLLAWRSSPTRFREDANSEDDLRYGGYRDRLLVELAQNAADAAAEAGVAGTLRLRVVPGADADSPVELRAANTGTPLSADGVAALAALRASAKRGETSVGRFGVGFAAVLAVSAEPSVVSTTGAVAFSSVRTSAIVAAEPELAAVAAERENTVPVLRLVWPFEAEPAPDGFQTEVRLPLRPEVDANALIEDCAAQAADLLLALPGLTRIEIEDRSWERVDHADGRVTVHGPDGPRHWLCRRSAGVLSEDELGETGAEARRRRAWSVCWALPVDAEGTPEPLSIDRLHAPTQTDDVLSLPARLLATVPLEPNRRRVRPGSALDAVLAHAARTYAELPGAVDPVQRVAVVPAPGFPRSELDEMLRERVLDALRETAWLPVSTGGDVEARHAVVVDEATPELVGLLADVIPGLLTSELGQPRYSSILGSLGVRRLGPAEVVAELAGQTRTPQWWQQLYAALAPIADGLADRRSELGALPVPLIDGRIVTGPRDVLLPDAELTAFTESTTVDVTGLRIAHPDAVHVLLETLGARRAGPADLLDSDPVREAVAVGLDEAEAGGDVTSLVELVLGLVTEAGEGARPWLAALPLRDSDGEWRPADELMLAGAPLASVLAEDVPLGVLDDSFVQRWSAEVLRRVGVVSGFGVLVVADPTGPDHDLADEERWWAEIDGDANPPAELVAVRDLDLVAADAWPAALRLLRNEPDTWRALHSSGYTGWWLARYALIEGRPLRQWRLAGAEELTGLYDPIPASVLAELGDHAEELLAAVGVRTELRIAEPSDASELLARLADSSLSVSAGTTLRVHRALADAVAAGVLDVDSIDPPETLRTLTGAVAGADEVVVLDEPWVLAVGDPARCVAIADPDLVAAAETSAGSSTAAGLPAVPVDGAAVAVAPPTGSGGAVELAELLDLPFASDEWTGEVASTGRAESWSDHAGVVTVSDLLGSPIPDGVLWLHADLRVRSRDAEHSVPWWVAEDGAMHAAETSHGVARALAWRLDRWSLRHLFAALLEQPGAAALLS
ncbi:sacsin N-terminal ATP-binding-like domain-containing protein [Actinoalloteichus hymeniacidonis]|uniref:Uncharacterized protein n=1 Tax=Actinoalloteichus hymeniacidonis TaxID=340345 RepID=A0AAC9N0X1_9PSEU|nr:ATP-binding protein [Actinoalloteichus hymeniacidonis]AOS65820.1 hypothetical protein TL08_25210 [Actinoalloteichus hymeniacidonis]MBB5906089.1 hypothetical protein [Actinoalloteichus hymeniacidonis]